MRLWPFNRKPEPEDDSDEPIEIIATPIAGLVYQLIMAGTPAQGIIAAVQAVESERIRAEVPLAKRDLSHEPVTKPRNHTRNHTRNHIKRERGPKKRKRANYMRGYRAKLRVVTRDGDAA